MATVFSLCSGSFPNTCRYSSDYNTLSMSDCHSIRDQARVVYLGLVLNVSSASSSVTALLRCSDSLGICGPVSHIIITLHLQRARPHRSNRSVLFWIILSASPAVRTELISKPIIVSNISQLARHTASF